MTWSIAAISEPASRTLDAWSVYEVPFDGQGRPWTRHFVGFKREGCVGQVSTAIEQFDPASRRGRSRSRRTYELGGQSGLDADARAMWGEWKRVNGIQMERDVTAEVESLLLPIRSNEVLVAYPSTVNRQPRRRNDHPL